MGSEGRDRRLNPKPARAPFSNIRHRIIPMEAQALVRVPPPKVLG